jgi:hypothetical protein
MDADVSTQLSGSGSMMWVSPTWMERSSVRSLDQYSFLTTPKSPCCTQQEVSPLYLLP